MQHEDLQEGRVLLEKVRVGTSQHMQGFQRVFDPVNRVKHVLLQAYQHVIRGCPKQLLLAAEIAVHRAFAHPGTVGNHLHICVAKPPLGKRLNRVLQHQGSPRVGLDLGKLQVSHAGRSLCSGVLWWHSLRGGAGRTDASVLGYRSPDPGARQCPMRARSPHALRAAAAVGNSRTRKSAGGEDGAAGNYWPAGKGSADEAYSLARSTMSGANCS